MKTEFVRSTAIAALLSLASAAPARAQLEIKPNDEVGIKFGVLGQAQADWLGDPSGGGTIQNLFIRRARLIVGGQVTKRVTFFLETDTPNLGKSTPPGSKNLQTGTILQDAYGEFKANDAFAVDAGLMYVPFSHNSLQSGATLLAIDYGPYTFAQSVPTQSSAGRDTGFQARGYLVSRRLEYRAGAFQGVRDARSHNPFRYAARLQYNFCDTDTAFFYSGTSLGKKRVVAVGGAVDAQRTYRGYDLDAFVDWPTGPGAVTGQLDYNHFNGGDTFASLPKQHDYLVELGYFIPAAKVSPIVQIAKKDLVDTSAGDEDRWSIGAAYWLAGHTANVKGAYSRIRPSGLPRQNEFSIQLQLFYF